MNQPQKYIISAVIPTKNRLEDLTKAVSSVLAQTRLPDEFIIVDQSYGGESKAMVDSLVSVGGPVQLIYIHNTAISGLVEAKKVATQNARGDIVCFLEDDLVLEGDYIANIERGFIEYPTMVGCCGIMTNMPQVPIGYTFYHSLFRRGIFKDDRAPVLYKAKRTASGMVPSKTLCGGLSAWRSEVFKHIPFDVENGFHMMEDTEFSTRVEAYYGPRLYINTNVRAEHRWSPVNRELGKAVYTRKLTETILFYKKRAQWPGARLNLIWLLLGLLMQCLCKSISNLSIYPLSGYWTGLRAGMAKKIFSK